MSAERPDPGRCSHWDGRAYCGRTEDVHPFLVGDRCPEHVPEHAYGYRGGS